MNNQFVYGLTAFVIRQRPFFKSKTEGPAMTQRLYDEDAYLTSFEARVVSCAEGTHGAEVVLDRSAFYPEGGGQPGDTGTLGGVKVLDTRERGGEVVHFCASPLEPGAAVSGEIDWARRFDHMQQHSGEHIVSGLICARYGCDNVGFHLGEKAGERIVRCADVPPSSDICAAVPYGGDRLDVPSSGVDPSPVIRCVDGHLGGIGQSYGFLIVIP